MLQNSSLLARNPHVAAVISDSPWKDTLSMWKLREQIKRDESFWGRRKPEFLFRTGGWIQNTKESSKQISQNLNTTIFPPMLIGLVILIAALVLLYSWSVLNAEELQAPKHTTCTTREQRMLPSHALTQKAFTRLQDINLRYSGRDWIEDQHVCSILWIWKIAAYIIILQSCCSGSDSFSVTGYVQVSFFTLSRPAWAFSTVIWNAVGFRVYVCTWLLQCWRQLFSSSWQIRCTGNYMPV